LEETTVLADHEVLMEVDNSIAAFIAGDLRWILVQLLVPHPM
jgi:hypothetical protein